MGHRRRRGLALLLAVAGAVSTVEAHPGAAIAISRSGDVYFIDTGHGLWKLLPDGRLEDLGPPPFHWFALDEQGRFARVRIRGSQYEVTAVRDGDRALVASSDFPVVVSGGGLYYAAPAGRADDLALFRVGPDGARDRVAALRGVSGSLRWINGIGVDGAGTLYITEDDAVQAVDSRGARRVVAREVSVPGCDGMREEGVRPPYLRGLAVGDDGAVYAAATGCRAVVRIEPGRPAAVVLRAEAPWSPTAVAVRDGDVYVLEYDHSGPERRWTPRVRVLRRGSPAARTLATVRR